MSKKIILALIGIISFSLSGRVSATGMHIQTIASTCMSCHGPGGKSLGDIPSLAGARKGLIVKRMQDYQSGRLAGTIMKRHASGYTAAEIEGLGEYFSGLK